MYMHELLPGLDRFLGDVGNAVHRERNFETVEMHTGGHRQLVVDDDTNVVADIHLDPRPGNGSVEGPRTHGFAG